jgi:Ras family
MYYRGASSAIIVFDVTSRVCDCLVLSRRFWRAPSSLPPPWLRSSGVIQWCQVMGEGTAAPRGPGCRHRAGREQVRPPFSSHQQRRERMQPAARFPIRLSCEVQEGNEYARENAIIYVETSAKTGTGVSQLFESIGASLACPHRFLSLT